jgi:hypothetical protein
VSFGGHPHGLVGERKCEGKTIWLEQEWWVFPQE